ncbi:hypothetical protein [Roseovarius sp. D22-M7]|uniref:hypothetical protein n=1 Tax=Roseovarius sp. D22-M7 TaxID=3127116 RepID=UPI00300F7F66
MIFRLAKSAALHTAGGVLFGVTAALAACTVAQAVQRGRLCTRTGTGGLDDVPRAAPSDPKATDPSTV